jgi:hypothetical protein
MLVESALAEFMDSASFLDLEQLFVNAPWIDIGSFALTVHASAGVSVALFPVWLPFQVVLEGLPHARGFLEFVGEVLVDSTSQSR